MEKEHVASRSAERATKQLETELKNSNAQSEHASKQRDVLEATLRKCQTSLDASNLDLQEKSQSLFVLQRGKEALESELKSLIDEIGDGGRNVHEMEKAKRRLESEITYLQTQLEEEQQARTFAEETKRNVEAEWAAYRQKIDAELLVKDEQMEETRKLLLREVNNLGEQLDEEQAAKSDLLKQRKKLEAELAQLAADGDREIRSKTDLDRSRKKAEASVRELTVKLEDECKMRRQTEEVAARQEKKFNSLQLEMETLQTQLETAERSKRPLEKRVEELESAQEATDVSKQSLMESKRRLEKEVTQLQESLAEEEDARAQMEQQLQESAIGRAASNTDQIAQEMQTKLDASEESRRAIAAAYRLAQQDIEDHKSSILSLEKQKRALQSDIAEVQSTVEDEVMKKNEEAAGRRKVAVELKEATGSLEIEVIKSRDILEQLDAFRHRFNQVGMQLENAELARIKAQKSETNLRILLREVEDSLAEALKERSIAETRAKSMNDQLSDLREKTEEDALEISDLSTLRTRLQSELDEERTRFKQDLEEEVEQLETLRKKYQKEFAQLSLELDEERRGASIAKELVRSLEVDLQQIQKRQGDAASQFESAKAEKERLELRVQDLLSMHQESSEALEEQASLATLMSTQVHDLSIKLDEFEAQKSASDRSKRLLETRISELNEQVRISQLSFQTLLFSSTQVKRKRWQWIVRPHPLSSISSSLKPHTKNKSS